MPVETTTGLPCRFSAGSTVRFTVSYDDYPASEWSLSFSILGPGAALSVAGVADGDGFLVTFTAAQTATLSPGQYQWAAKVTETATQDATIAASGSVTVRPDLSNTEIGPWRTKFNAAVAAFSALSAGQYTSIDVEGQSFTTRDATQQKAMLDYLEEKAIGEDKMLGRSTSGNTKKVVFYL